MFFREREEGELVPSLHMQRDREKNLSQISSKMDDVVLRVAKMARSQLNHPEWVRDSIETERCKNSWRVSHG